MRDDTINSRKNNIKIYKKYLYKGGAGRVQSLDRQTDRQTDIQTDRQTDSMACMDHVVRRQEHPLHSGALSLCFSLWTAWAGLACSPTDCAIGSLWLLLAPTDSPMADPAHDISCLLALACLLSPMAHCWLFPLLA